MFNKLKKINPILVKRTFLLILLLGNLFIFINIWILTSTKNQIIQSRENMDTKQAAIIPGAYVYSDGTLSFMLKDRVDTCLTLYRDGNVKKFLVTGDHGTVAYDEVNSMKDYLLNKGIPREDIFLDHAGFDTYDSLYRAKAIFQVESAFICTQDFHLPRAVYIGNSMEIDTVGVVSNKREYMGKIYNNIRESLARVKTFFDVTLHAKPTYLGEIIPITGDSKLSWDEG